MPEVFFKIGFFIMLALIAIGGVTQARTRSYLRARHHQAWVRLGGPSFFNNSPRNSVRSMKFLFRREYLKIADPHLTALCNTSLIVNILALSVFATFMIAGNVFGVAK